MKRIGCIGLGTMGSAMSANLIQAGFRVFGYDIAQARRSQLDRAGGFPVSSSFEVAERTPVIITSLPSAKALLAVCKEIQQIGRKGQIIVETSKLPIAVKESAR